jgi:predicted component of type VI protein secretion system
MRHYMFVRFRETGDRLQVSLVETRRIGGKVRHEHLVGLGSIELPMMVEARLAFWRTLEDRLARLGNRISADDSAKVRGALFARIPMPSIDEQRAVQLANAEADAELAGKLRDRHAASVADHERFVTTAKQKTAAHRAALAEADAQVAAARERVAAIKRGNPRISSFVIAAASPLRPKVSTPGCAPVYPAAYPKG